MKKLKLLLLIIAVVSAISPTRAYENLAGTMSSWATEVASPAWGTITPGVVAFRSDSVFVANVRYTAVSDAPSATMTRTLIAPQPEKYRFSAWVNLTRTDACLTLSARDAKGLCIGSVTVSSTPSAPGALTPGRWTPVSLEVDLSNADIETRRSVTFAFEPMWNGTVAYTTDFAPAILISDITITAGTIIDVANGEFERWSDTTTGTGRYPVGWSASTIERVAGVHANDNAVRIAPGQNITTTTVPTTALPGSRLRLVARADHATKIYLKDSNATTRAQASLRPGVWREIVIPVAVSGELNLSADNTWSLDGVRIEEVYDLNTPHPTERTLHVTTSADNGPGSLRAAVDEACTGDRIVFDVNTVNLETSIDLSDKYITIDGGVGAVNPDRRIEIVVGTKGESAFTFSPDANGTVLRLNQLIIKGSTENVSNGGGLYVGDSRSTGTARIILTKVTFDCLSAKNAGGAIYLTAPNVETLINHCTFRNCSATNGAAIAFARGASLGIFTSDFDGCTSTGTVGGAIASTSTSDAPVTISACDFTRCTSTATTGGAGAVSITSVSTPTRINRCQFDYCGGGRAAAINIYNNSRTATKAEVAISNCTAVNNTGTSPVVFVGMTSRYTGPDVTMVNNLIVNNESGGLTVAGGTVTGSHNVLDNTSITLDNPIDVGSGRIFLEYDDEDHPKRCAVQRSPYGIDINGPVFDKGSRSYLLASGEDIVNTDAFEGPIAGYEVTTTSVGASEYHGPDGGVDGVETDFAGVRVWPNPATTTLNVDGDYNRMWITDMSGATVLTANGASVDVSALPRGLYFASFESNGIIFTTKIIIR